MKRKMYELILAADQWPAFWVDEEEKCLRHISHPKAVTALHQEIGNYHWSVKDGWKIDSKKRYNTKVTFPLMSINADELIPYIKVQIPAFEENQSDIEGNYIIVHRKAGDIIHIGMGIYDAITDRPVHWLD